MSAASILAAARRSPSRILLGGTLAIVAVLSAAPARPAAPVAPEWNNDPRLDSSDGYAQLSWGVPLEGEDADVAWVYHLQEARRPVFNDTDVQYMGTQHSSFVSGLENGAYYYRVRARRPDEEEWGPWSTVVRVDVQHHDRNLALGLMGIGAVVFLTTAGFLLRHRNDPVPSRAPGGPGR